MVSACTFHLQSWERRHDRHGKWLAVAPSPAHLPEPGRAGPGREISLQARRGACPVVGHWPLAHSCPPSRAGEEPDRWSPCPISPSPSSLCI